MQGRDGYDEFDEFDDFETEETFTPPPHRDDRLWRHPSEMRAAAPSPSEDPTPALGTPAARFVPDFVPEPFVELIPTGEQLVLVPNGPDLDNGAGRGRAFALASTALLGLLILGGFQLQSARESAPSASVTLTPTPETARENQSPSVSWAASTESARPSADAGSLATAATADYQNVQQADQRQITAVAVSARDWTAELSDRLVGVISTMDVVVDGEVLPGYGIVFDDEGHVVTSARLVRNASHIIVRTDDLRHTARVVGSDSRTDIAVLHVPHVLNAATLNPVADQWSGRSVLIPDPSQPELITTHVLHRDGQASWPGQDRIFGLLQLDLPAAAVAAGAPLIDDLGQVVGMGVYESEAPIGGDAAAFAIPSAVINRVASSIITTGSVQHPWLGLEVRDSSDDAVRGAEVVRVLAGSPAASVGITEGDVIVSFNGEPIMSMGDLVSNIQRRSPGDEVMLSWSRDGLAQHGATTLTFSGD